MQVNTMKAPWSENDFILRGTRAPTPAVQNRVRIRLKTLCFISRSGVTMECSEKMRSCAAAHRQGWVGWLLKLRRNFIRVCRITA